MASMFQLRHNVYAFSDRRPLEDKRPIGSAVTERGAKRVYWSWEVKTFQPGQRWYPLSMNQDIRGDWYLGEAQKR